MNWYSSLYETANSLDQVNNVNQKEIAQNRLCKDCEIIVSYAGSIYYINATAPRLLPCSIRIIKVSIEMFMVTVFWTSAITAVMPAQCEAMLADVGVRQSEREKNICEKLNDHVIV